MKSIFESTTLRIIAIIAILYLFLLSVGMIGAGFKGLGSEFAKTLFTNEASPFIGLFIGILATGLFQSSSTTTSLVVGMVAGGTFGDDPAIAVSSAIPYIMGANIGTSITNTIVSVGHIGDKIEFKRAFSASIIHDFFNILSVSILFPLELLFGLISKSGIWLSSALIGSAEISFNSPIKAMTKPIVKMIQELLDKQQIIDPSFLLLLMAISFLFFSLRNLTKLIKSLVMLRLESFFDTHIFKTTIRAMLFGVIITFMVQSSSITTSLVVPLAGAGILKLRQIFPYTLGANIGTTMTSILASLATGTVQSLSVAFGHLLFNVFGIALIWPIPQLREIPITFSLKFAELATKNKIYPFLYIVIVFFIIPLLLITIVR
tara:strand:- start:1402 stop:2529 length:1128 start_codon:yes stop_codon:yes gene_type:complete